MKLKWLILDTPESILTPQFVQEQLRQIGVEIELEVSDRGTFTQRRDAGDYQLITMDNVAGICRSAACFTPISSSVVPVPMMRATATRSSMRSSSNNSLS